MLGIVSPVADHLVKAPATIGRLGAASLTG
jgi:hypothetical protein